MHGAVAQAVSSLPEALASAEARARLAALSCSLGAIGEPFGFECRLSAGEHPVDFGFAVARQHAEYLLGATVGARAHANAFARGWTQDAALRSWVPFLFLEFDAGCALDPVPTPSVFAALDSPLAIRPGLSPELDAALEVVALLGGGTSIRSLDVVRRAHELLPPGGRFLHVGVMTGRPGRSVRLSLLLDGAAIPDYFAALCAPGAAAAARCAVQRFGTRLAPAQVDFDCGPPIDARIGIGLRPDPTGGLDAALVEHAKASPMRIASLARWDGRLSTGGELRRKRLSHLKLVCAPGGIVEAKAYLEVGAPSTDD